MRWQTEGLNKPQAVEDATREYLEAVAAKLFASWKAWTELNGVFTGTARAFGMNLAEHGFDKKPSMIGNMYRGLDLIEENNQPWPEL